VSAEFIVKPGRRKLKVHQANGVGRPVCGGGHMGCMVIAWQQEIGPPTCRRCKQILERRPMVNGELVV
jgi:hypothetical protein